VLARRHPRANLAVTPPDAITVMEHSVRAPPDQANCGPRAVRAADRSSLALRPQAARSQLARSASGVFQFRFGSSRSPSVLPETLRFFPKPFRSP
jgi:hypothetical protein